MIKNVIIRKKGGRIRLLYVVPKAAPAQTLIRRSGTAGANLAAVPALYAPNPEAAKRFIEYFAANIRNPNTRRAYLHAVREFADWCAFQGFHEIVDIEPLHVAAYIEQLTTRLAKPSVKQHLAAIRMLFDWLVVGQVVTANPAAPVRGPNYTVKKGKTPLRVVIPDSHLGDRADAPEGVDHHRNERPIPEAHHRGDVNGLEELASFILLENRRRVSGHSVRVGATQDLLALNIDLASVMQEGRWKSTRMLMRCGEEVLAARGGMARAAEAQGRDDAGQLYK
jgi:hypothetical protein